MAIDPNCSFRFGPEPPNYSKEQTVSILNNYKCSIWLKDSFYFTKHPFRFFKMLQDFYCSHDIERFIAKWQFMGIAMNKAYLRSSPFGKVYRPFIIIKT